MHRLLAIRDLNQGDPLPGLGQKVEKPTREEQPARPQPLPHNPEIKRRPDGTLETEIERNKSARWEELQDLVVSSMNKLHEEVMKTHFYSTNWSEQFWQEWEPKPPARVARRVTVSDIGRRFEHPWLNFTMRLAGVYTTSVTFFAEETDESWVFNPHQTFIPL